MTPYSYIRAKRQLTCVLRDMRVLAGDETGPSGASWQDIAGDAATALRLLAGLLESARLGRISDGPPVFPSPDDCQGD